MSRQRNVNHELLCRSQLMTLLSVKFLFVREGVATDDGITEKTRGKGRGREGGIDYILKNYKGLISYLDPPDCNCNCN